MNKILSLIGVSVLLLTVAVTNVSATNKEVKETKKEVTKITKTDSHNVNISDNQVVIIKCEQANGNVVTQTQIPGSDKVDETAKVAAETQSLGTVAQQNNCAVNVYIKSDVPVTPTVTVAPTATVMPTATPTPVVVTNTVTVTKVVEVPKAAPATGHAQ